MISIERSAFASCYGLTSVTIPSSVTSIGSYAFQGCTSLRGVYFRGNAPSTGAGTFDRDDSAAIYYLPGTTGWGSTFGGRPTVPGSWPEILTPPVSQTAEVGTTVSLRVKADGSPAPTYRWRFNNNVVAGYTNSLLLTNVQFHQAGSYTVEVGNGFGSITSAPAMLSIIPPVERRLVPGLILMAQSNSLLNLEYRSSLLMTQDWESFPTLYFTNSPQFFFDLTSPLPSQRFYRASQTAPVSMSPSLNLHMIPALTLTGNPGDQIRVDGINRYGPTDAWFTLDTVTLTNTSQLYFDDTAPVQPPRLYRLVPVP